MSAIQINGFSKKYGELSAVNTVDLAIGAGELFGLIGPDGAGKTTLLRSMCTLLKPTAGTIIINGFDSSRNILDIRQILGYMPQRFSLYQDLTVEQNLQFFADLFQVADKERDSRLERLYQFSRLAPFKKRLAGALSGGMKQKLALSCALIHTPEILILDEPTYGVDPLSRQEFWDILLSIHKEGTTIIVSTAYMEEAELCDRVALLHRGNIIQVGEPSAIKDGFPYPLFRVESDNLPELIAFYSHLEIVQSTQIFGQAVHISLREDPSDEQWEKWQQDSGHLLKSWAKLSPSMEDVFMELIREEN